MHRGLWGHEEHSATPSLAQLPPTLKVFSDLIGQIDLTIVQSVFPGPPFLPCVTVHSASLTHLYFSFQSFLPRSNGSPWGHFQRKVHTNWLIYAGWKREQVGSISKMLLKMKCFLSSKIQSLTQMPFSVTILSTAIGTLCMDNTFVIFFIVRQNSTKGIQLLIPENSHQDHALKSQIHSWVLKCSSPSIVSGTLWADMTLGDMKNK